MPIRQDMFSYQGKVLQAIAGYSKILKRLNWYLSQPRSDLSRPKIVVSLIRLFRLLLWFFHRLLKIHRLVRFSNYRLIIQIPASTGTPSLVYVLREDYEPELGYFVGLLRLGKTFFDVGANFVVYTLLAIRKVGPHGSVIAVELVPANLDVLRSNVRINRCENVYIVGCAAIDCGAMVKIHLDRTDPGSVSLGVTENVVDSITVRAEPLNSIIDSKKIRVVHVLKIDVEGAEELVLRSPLTIIRESTLVVMFEVSPTRSLWIRMDPLGPCIILKQEAYELYRLLGWILVPWNPGCGEIEEIRLGHGRVTVIALPYGGKPDMIDATVVPSH